MKLTTSVCYVIVVRNVTIKKEEEQSSLYNNEKKTDSIKKIDWYLSLIF